MARRKTPEEFIDDVSDLVGDEYSVLGTYTRSKDEIEMKHNICGTRWEIRPNNFITGKRCPVCSRTKTTKEYMDEVLTKTKGQLEIRGEYRGATSPILVRCTIHDHEFTSRPDNISRGRMVCKKCNAEYLSKTQRKKTGIFLKELSRKHKGSITSSGEYTNTHTKVELNCNDCGTDFRASPNSILRLSGCPTCAEPKGESGIREYLIRNSIEFEPNKYFEECRNIRPLPFDFYVPEYNLLIEYDGKQHFEPIEFFGGVEAFESQLHRDSIKNVFAKDNGIEILRIPYTTTGNKIDELLEGYFRSSKPSLKRESKAENPTPKCRIMI